MKDFVNVGLLGAGTVGGGVLKVLEKNAEKIANRCSEQGLWQARRTKK